MISDLATTNTVSNYTSATYQSCILRPVITLALTLTELEQFLLCFGHFTVFALWRNKTERYLSTMNELSKTEGKDIG
jgi:hypothetical protein